MTTAEDWVVVLAAGRGKRMGGPKALMEVDAQPWWRRQDAALKAIGLPAVWVVSEQVRDAMEADGADVDWMAIADPDAPMFASIIAGMSALEPSPGWHRSPDRCCVRGVFVLPIDVPAPAESVWDTLADAQGDVRVPAFKGKRGHPLYLTWSWIERRLLPVRAEEKWEARCRLDDLMRSDAMDVMVGDANVVVDLNRREDVQDWRSSG